MAKDPAFLFYPKDWLQGTAQMMPEEKGIYIDLLSHQHQNGTLPADQTRLARMVGLTKTDFERVFAAIKDKFLDDGNGNLVNQKLTNVVTDRLTKSKAKRVTGTFASVVRLSKLSTNVKEQIKSEFNYNDFMKVGDKDLTEKITVWFNQKANLVKG